MHPIHAITPFLLLFSIATLSGCESNSLDETSEDRWYTESQVNAGKSVFITNCGQCHGNNAEATNKWKQTLPDGSYPPPPLNGSAHAWHHSLSALKRSINNGGVALGGKMPAFKDKLTEVEKEAVIAYFQSKWNKKIYDAWIARGGLE